MPRSITAKTISGIIAVADGKSWDTNCHSDSESIVGRASGKGFFVIDTEDEAELRIEVVVDGEDPPKSIDAYEAIGGAFRVSLPSGSLRIADPGDRTPGYCLDLPAGTYCLSAKRLNTQDFSNHLRHVRTAVGDDDWSYHERIGKIELTGCGTVVLAILLAIIPFTRSYWWIFVPVLFAPYLIAWLLKCTQRYKRAEKARSAFEGQQPHLILLLSLDNRLSDSVRGGTIHFN
ncbi:MAG: hypothetical protein ACSHX0_05475 [Akkermansiaceae bacterium]